MKAQNRTQNSCLYASFHLQRHKNERDFDDTYRTGTVTTKMTTILLTMQNFFDCERVNVPCSLFMQLIVNLAKEYKSVSSLPEEMSFHKQSM